MPSHPERVRRNYHEVLLLTTDAHWSDSWDIMLKISRAEIASTLSARELKRWILRRIEQAIDRDYPR